MTRQSKRTSEGNELATTLPAPTPHALLTPRFLRLCHHPADALLRRLRINAAPAWHSNVPVRLRAARADRTTSLILVLP